MTDTEYPKFPRRNSLDYKTILANKSMKELKLPVLLILLHIPLGVLLYGSSAFALLHPLVVLCLGLYWAARKNEKIEKVAYVAAYLAGSEVLWRMAQSSVFWEFGKYGIALIMAVALVNRGYWKIPKLPLGYFILLLPSGLITFLNNSTSEARGKLSFNLSGPLALFVCCWFFSYVRVNTQVLKRLLLTLTIPIISVAVTTLIYTVTNEDIQFNTESNFATSGGFGPNQVSSMLGLGVFTCITIFLLFKNDLSHLVYLGVFTVFFAAQSVMTFSRGGIYAAIGASLAVTFFQMQDLSKGVKKLVPVIGLALMFLLFIFPYMNDFTGGKLQERFEDSGTTNRTEIVVSDYLLLLEHPILGTGVGESRTSREKIIGFDAASHTEFSRLVSEHGSLGFLAVLALGLATVYNLKRQKLSVGKALVAGVIAWSGLFMLNAGMRLAMPSFLWGLSFITIVTPQIRRVVRGVRSKAVPVANRWQTSGGEKSGEY